MTVSELDSITVAELFDFIKGVRPGFAFTDAQMMVWLNEIEGKVQTDILLLSPVGLVQYDATINPTTQKMVDADTKLIVPYPWNKLYRYFMLMSIDLYNGEYQRYGNTFAQFNEAYEEYAAWVAQNLAPANGLAVAHGYYLTAYQFAVKGGFSGTQEDFERALNDISNAQGYAQEAQYWAGVSQAYSGQHVTPEMYGAKGDGVTNDAAAILQAVRTGEVVDFRSGATYIFRDTDHETIVVNKNITINGNGAILKRPNLKEYPYNCSDNEIKWDQFFIFRNQSSKEFAVRINDLTFDGNAFSMWTPDGTLANDYKYEQASFIVVSGREVLTPLNDNYYYHVAQQTHIILSGCVFKDNFASGVSCQNGTNATFSNCAATNCFKGMMTFVGHGSTLLVDNIVIENDYAFHSINIEINPQYYYDSDGREHSPRTAIPWSLRDQSSVQLNNLHVDNAFKIGAMTGLGCTEVNNLYATGITYFNMATSSSVLVENSYIEFSASGSTKQFAYINDTSSDIHPSFLYSNCVFKGVDGYPTASIDIRTGAGNKASVEFRGCKFEHINKVAEDTTSTADVYINFIDCIFHDISSMCVGSSGSFLFYAKEVLFEGCTLDLNNADAYISYYMNTSDKPKFKFSNNRIISPCKGIQANGTFNNIYDSSYNTCPDEFHFNDEKWEYGLNVATYYPAGTDGTHIYNRGLLWKPKATGRRYRYLNANPSGLAFNDVDIAFVTSDGVTTKWEYKNDRWDPIPNTFGTTAKRPNAVADGTRYYSTSIYQTLEWNGKNWYVVEAGYGNAYPLSPKVGDEYYNSTSGDYSFWDGTNWIVITSDHGSTSERPTQVTDGDYYYDTDIHMLIRAKNVSNTIEWRSPRPTSGNSLPATSKTGNQYYNTTTHTLSIWNGTEWIATATNGGTTSNHPFSVEIGFQYFDTTLGKQIVWNGSDWVNADGTALS